MAEHIRIANKLFMLLAFAANAVVVVAIVLAVVALVSERGRAFAGRVVDAVGRDAMWLAFLVAVVCTAGSLYYSEVANFTPCLLCWYQRICMYPLVVVLGVGAWKHAPVARLMAVPFLVCGVALSSYHFLVEQFPSLGSSLSCSLEAPCTVPWFQELGFVTIAYMALSGFLLIATLVIVDALHDRRAAAAPRPEVTAS